MMLFNTVAYLYSYIGCYSWNFWPPTEVCHGSYGCFSTQEPFTNSKRCLPQSPQEVNVSIEHHTRQGSWKAAIGYIPETDVHKPTTKFIIHGYLGSKSDNWVQNMTQELLNKDDSNVFVVNWKHGADDVIYQQAVANTRMVAAVVAEYLKWFMDFYKIPSKSVHLIGASLGAHIAGYIGQEIKIGRITGLDPASYSFKYVDDEVALSPDDAEFVDVIHTDDYYGLSYPIGDVDFFVNGGNEQPGCDWFSDWHACSHSRAFDLFVESINTPCKFRSFPCDINQVKEGKTLCTSCGVKGCNVMGIDALKRPSGVFYTSTMETKPFCRNNDALP